MTWLTWRQFRTQAWITLGVLVALAVALSFAGAHIASLYRASGLATCTGAQCSDLTDSFLSQARQGFVGPVRVLGLGLAYLAPALIGAFWGAPLVGRELETGTFRLVWTQSVSRTRWLSVKLALLGLATVLSAGVVALVVTWSSSRVDSVAGRMEPLAFGSRGVVPVAYALLAFSVGVLAGILLRRTVPAMAVTLAAVAAVQMAMPTWIRAHLVTPLVQTRALDPTKGAGIGLQSDGHIRVWIEPHIPGAWILGNSTALPSGEAFDGVADPTYCSRSVSPEKCLDWVAGKHLHSVVTYQPGSRFWTLQWIEAGIVVALAAVAVALCFWALRRRAA